MKKKITKALAILAALTTLGASVVPAYADEAKAAVDITAEQQSVEKTAELLNSFIESSRIYAYALVDDLLGKVMIQVYDGREKDEVKSAVQTFIEENGIDGNIVDYMIYDITHTTPGVRKAEYLLNRYIEKNDIDASCCYCISGKNEEELWSVDENGTPSFTMPDLDDERYWGDVDYLWVEYFSQEARKAVEEYIETLDVDMNHVMIKEMDEDEKLNHLIYYRLGKYACDNALRLGVGHKQYDDGTWGISVRYYLGHEADRDMMEAYISEKGYDRTAKITYDFIGDPDADPGELIDDPYEISRLLEEYVEDNNISGWVSIMKNQNDEAAAVNVTLKGDSDDLGRKALNEFMTEKRIDQSIVTILCLEVGIADVISCDVNNDGETNIRDCAVIARELANGRGKELPASADYNNDGIVNIRDAAGLAKYLSEHRAVTR